MKKNIGIIVLFIILIITVSACGKKAAPTSAEEGDNQDIVVSVEKIVKSDIESVVSLNGKVKPIQEINIIPKVPGKVDKVNFEVGQKVNKDDILFILEQKDIVLQVKQAEASLRSAEVALQRAQGGAVEQQISQLQTNLSAAKINYNDAKLSYDRTKQLYEAGGASRQMLESAETGLKLREDQYNAAKDALEITQGKINPESIAAAQAGVNQAKAAYDIVKSQLDNTVIRSPISGIIATVNVEEGELVGSSGVAMSVIDLSSVIVEVNASENMINKIHLGDKVQTKVTSISNNFMQGEVISVSPAADMQNQNYPVKIKIDNENRLLKSGMFSEVRFTSEKVKKVIAVPITAILDEDGKKYCYIAQDDKAKKIEVSIGLSNEHMVEVVSGLEEGQNVIIKGQNFVQDGSKISIVD